MHILDHSLISLLSQLRLIRNDGSLVCSDGPYGTDEHELCGITLFGQTKRGTDDEYRYYTNENGTDVYEFYRVYIQLESSLEDVERPTHVYFSVAVIENTAGHATWNNVTIHNVKVRKRQTNKKKEHTCIIHSCLGSVVFMISILYEGRPESFRTVSTS